MSGLFKGSKQTVRQDPLQTPEQEEAQKQLLSLAQTGGFGGITLGDPYGGSLGDFNATGLEDLSQNRLMGLIQQGLPQSSQVAQSTLTNLANTEFNPDDPSSGFGGFQRQVARATGQADDVLNREAAVTGNRFGNRLQGSKVDLAERQSDILATKLGDLFNAQQNRALGAAGGLAGLGQQEQGLIQSGLQLGGLDRLLKNQEAQSKLQEFMRQRDESLSRIGILENSANRNVPFGVREQTVETPSPFSSLLNSALGGIGQGFGAELGLGKLGAKAASGAGQALGGLSLSGLASGAGGALSSAGGAIAGGVSSLGSMLAPLLGFL